MRLLAAHLRLSLLETLRQPGFWLPSVSFPTVLFLFFGMELARGRSPLATGYADAEELILVQFILAGVLSVMFFTFGVGIAEDRRHPWERQVRTMPVGSATRFGARVMTAGVLSVLSGIPVSLLAVLTTPIFLDLGDWLLLVVTVLVGAVPFGLFGIALGYAVSPRAALPLANIGFLFASFAGGLLVPLSMLPGFLRRASPYLPTYHWDQFVDNVLMHGDDLGSWGGYGLYLVGWSVLAFGMAAWAYRRDEGVRFR